MTHVKFVLMDILCDTEKMFVFALRKTRTITRGESLVGDYRYVYEVGVEVS